ncbi:hypothetical protein [Advenella incenata]|uniref:hypothetical protein n=1 Tax=Advenella incenata TaxID=267800 RepID=UPI0010299BD5
MNQGSLNQGSLNQGSLNQGSLNQGSLNQGSQNQGSLMPVPRNKKVYLLRRSRHQQNSKLAASTG